VLSVGRGARSPYGFEVWAGRRAGWTSVGVLGRRVGWVVSSLREVCDGFFPTVGMLNEGECGRGLVSSFCCACEGKGGRVRLCGAGTGLRATLFFDTSHSGRGVAGSSLRDVPGTWFFELARSGMEEKGNSVSSITPGDAVMITS
jgi:hypothetical protein